MERNFAITLSKETSEFPFSSIRDPFIAIFARMYQRHRGRKGREEALIAPLH